VKTMVAPVVQRPRRVAEVNPASESEVNLASESEVNPASEAEMNPASKAEVNPASEAEMNPASGGQGAASARANRTRVYRRALRDLLRIESTMDFHRYGIEHAIERYRVLREEQGLGLGTVLSIGSTYREAQRFVEHPFEEICLTGILDSDDGLREVASSDPRVRYEKQNCERLSYASGSFDLVFCKESLHHLTRPVQGLYEMLRVCRANRTSSAISNGATTSSTAGIANNSRSR